MVDKLSLKEDFNLEAIAETIRNWLSQDEGWKERFATHASEMLKKEDYFKRVKKSFHKAKNLNLYTCIADIISKKGINLRYKGQSVAYLKERNGILTLFADEKLSQNNADYFDWTEELNCAWDSPTAERFRKHFSQNLVKKGHVEHRLESMLIEELSKQLAKDKILCGIQPVRIFNQFAFQMKTALKASDKEIHKSKQGGGIDILARVKQGDNVNLCVIELKKTAPKDERKANIIWAQGVAYAVFLRELLRSKSGKQWFEIFGYSRNIPKSLIINVCLAAPLGSYIPETKEKNIFIEDDVLQLKYLVFEEDGKNITSIKTDL